MGHDPFQVGLALKSEGLTAKHPVVMIPGVISTGNEYHLVCERMSC